MGSSMDCKRGSQQRSLQNALQMVQCVSVVPDAPAETPVVAVALIARSSFWRPSSLVGSQASRVAARAPYHLSEQVIRHQ
jgi:hypothetical protein